MMSDESSKDRAAPLQETDESPSEDLTLLTGDAQTGLRSGSFIQVEGERNITVGGSVIHGTFITGNNVTVQLPPAPALMQRRAPVGDFVGREREAETLINEMQRKGRAPICGISGMGGVGKTELALVVADRLRDDYPDQLMIDLRGTSEEPRTPIEALEVCIRALSEQESKLPEDLNQLISLYQKKLSGRRVLILLDNAASHDQVRPLMPPQGCALLLTSRRTLTLPGITPLVLDQLPSPEARELLTSIANHISPDMADQICSLCEYLPLAIRAAGSLLAETIDLDSADYIIQLRDERTRLEALKPGDASLSVEASFNLSYARLTEEKAYVFRQLAVFPASFDAAAEEVVCEDSSHASLSELVRLNLVMYYRESKRYRLHDLARLFAASRLSDSERTSVARRHSSHYLRVLYAADDLYKRGGEGVRLGLTLYDLERGNIEAGQGWSQARVDEEVGRWCIDYAMQGIGVLCLRQHPRETIRWLEAALSAARSFNDKQNEGNILGHLGNTYWSLGDVRKTIEYNEQALEIFREIKDRRGEGGALGNLSIGYANLGQTRKAIEYLEQRLIIAQEIGDNRGKGTALGNLGVAYWSLGEVSKAIEFFEQHLAISRALGDRAAEGNALGNLGNAYADLKDTHKAIDSYEQRLAIAREIGDRRGEGNALSNLGVAYWALGDVGKAVQYYEQALVIAREIGDRRAEATTLWNLSLSSASLRKNAEAIAHAQEALNIFEQMESPFAPKVRQQLDKWINKQ